MKADLVPGAQKSRQHVGMLFCHMARNVETGFDAETGKKLDETPETGSRPEIADLMDAEPLRRLISERPEKRGIGVDIDGQENSGTLALRPAIGRKR